MKKIFLLIALLAVSFAGVAQKVKIKKDIATVDKVEYAKVIEDKLARACYNIQTLTGTDVVYIRFNEYNDPMEMSKANPDGRVFYYEVMSPDLETVLYETDLKGCLMGCNAAENVIKEFFLSDVINADGTVNEKKLDMLAKKKGFAYSRKRQEK